MHEWLDPVGRNLVFLSAAYLGFQYIKRYCASDFCSIKSVFFLAEVAVTGSWLSVSSHCVNSHVPLWLGVALEHPR